MKRTKIELTVERRRRLIIRRTNTLTETWCAACGRQVIMISVEEAVKLTGKGEREIHTQVEQGTIHPGERPDRTLLICVESLLASF